MILPVSSGLCLVPYVPDPSIKLSPLERKTSFTSQYLLEVALECHICKF